jgi:hypothetical protein
MLLIYVAQTDFYLKKTNFPVQQQSLSSNKHRTAYKFMHHHNGVQNLTMKDKDSLESSNVQIFGNNDN